MTSPTARPIAQQMGASNPYPQGQFPPDSTGKDCIATPSIYITADRLHRIASDMTERDREVLNFVSGSRLATGKQLVKRFWDAERDSDPARTRAGRRTLKRLADWRVLDPLSGRARGGVRGGSSTLIYGVGVAGTKLLAQRGLHQKRLGVPAAAYVAHTITCTQIAVDLHVANTRGDLDLIEVQQEPECHRAFIGAMGRAVLKPDLFARVGVGALEDRWFIECDLSTEHTTTLLAKTKRYLAHYRSGSEQRDHGVYPRIVFAVPDDRRAEQIKNVLRRLPAAAQRMFAVCLLDEVAGFLASEARA